MIDNSVTDSCSALRDEIRHLEEQLRVLDGELATEVPPGEDEAVSGSLKREEEVLPPPVLAKASESEDRQLEEEPLETAIPFRKVEFREDDDPPERKEVRLLRWLGFSVVLVSLIGLGSVVVLPALRANEQGLATEPSSPVMASSLEDDILMAEAALRDFYLAESIESVLGKVREPKALEPLIRAHYERFPFAPCEVDIDAGAERVYHGDETFILSVISLPEATHGRRVAVAMTSEGPKVDWELAANAQKSSWKKFPQTPIMMSARAFRVDLEHSNYFNHGFEESEWTCFRMSAPGVDDPSFAYAPRRSQLSERLLQTIQQERTGTAQVIVSVAVGGRVDELPQLRILDLIRDHWVLDGASLPLQKPLPGNIVSFN